MGRKRPTPEEIIGTLGEAEIVLAEGRTASDASRRIAVSAQTPAFAGAGSITAGARNMAV